jgi:hypothetical protein
VMLWWKQKLPTKLEQIPVVFTHSLHV